MSPRRLLALGAALAATTLGCAVTGPAQAAPKPAGGDDAVQQFGSCLAAGGQGELLIVLDTSASLQQTDPDADRVTAAKYMVDQLADFVGRDGGLKLDVAVAGFADAFDPSLDWTALSSSTAGTVDSAIEGYRSQDTGFETDYWNAVSGARRYLADKAGDGDCQAWVWFSDGMYDLDRRDSSTEQDQYGLTKPYGPDVDLTSDSAADRVQKAGEQDLCRSGGAADSLRFQGVTTLAVGLGAADSFDLMKGIATGAPRCGHRSAAHLGDFVLASDIDALLFAFDKYADPGTAPIQQQTPLCRGTVCPEGAHVFFLDDTISKVHVLGGASMDDYHAVLVDPRGKQHLLQPGKPVAPAPGFDLSGTWATGRTFELDMAKQGPVWSGRWQLVFVADGAPNGALANTNIRLFGDVRPTWTDQRSSVTSGDPARVTLGLEDSGGTPVKHLLGSATLRAELRPAAGAPVELPTLDAASIGTPQRLDLANVSPGPANLVLTLDVTTKGSQGSPGTALQPVVRQFPVTIAPPREYPTIASTIDLGTGSSLDPVTSSIPMSGAPGCAWLQSSDVATLPDGVEHADVSSSATRSAPATSSLPVTVKVDALGNGLVGGTLTVATTSKGCGGKVVPVTVRFTYELERPRNEKVFIGLLVAIMAGGVLLPVGMLYLMKWRTAAVPGSSLAVASVRGPVTPTSSFLSSATLTHEDTRAIPLEGADRRNLPLTPRVTVRTRIGLGLTEPGYASVEPKPVVTSTGGPRLPLAIQDRWIAALDPVDPHHGDVEFVFVLSASLTKLPELLADARNRGPELVARLRAALGEPPPAPPSSAADAGWGAGSGTGPSAGPTPGTGQQAPGGYDQW